MTSVACGVQPAGSQIAAALNRGGLTCDAGSGDVRVKSGSGREVAMMLGRIEEAQIVQYRSSGPGAARIDLVCESGAERPAVVSIDIGSSPAGGAGAGAGAGIGQW